MLSLFVLMFMLAATVFSGAFIAAVVATPQLYDLGTTTIPIAVALGMALALPVAWFVARAIRRQTAAR